jgi:hypothetical protein
MTKLKWYIIILLLAFSEWSVTAASASRSSSISSSRSSYQINSNRAGIPDWQIDSEFKEDVFTFVRIRYTSRSSSSGRSLSGGTWSTDYPDSELNFSFRLHQLTSMEVNPNPIVLELTSPELFNYPFIYIVEPGRLVFNNNEIAALRRYLLNGGFLMIDDFWGQAEWENISFEMKRVFPEREPKELTLKHPIFNCVFVLKEKPQIPSISYALSGKTSERDDALTPHYLGIYDDKGRMMVLICRDTDLGDGWEREAENEWYFHEFSEKKAYPLGINIVFYVMTH